MKKALVTLFFALLFYTIGMAALHSQDVITTPTAKVYVLCFHSFWGNHPEYPYDFSREEFAAILDQFINAGFKFVTMDDIFAGTPIGTKNLLVTIDDGNRSVYDAFHQVLEPRGVKPLLAIIGGSIEAIPQDLTWSQLEELQSCGCYIAAHGWFHIMADDRLFVLSPELFDQELIKSRERIEKHLPSQPIVVYVYPYGKYIPQDNMEVPKYGYLLAFSLKRQPLYLPLIGSTQNHFNLPRYIFDQGGCQALIDQILKDSLAPVAQR